MRCLNITLLLYSKQQRQAAIHNTCPSKFKRDMRCSYHTSKKNQTHTVTHKTHPTPNATRVGFLRGLSARLPYNPVDIPDDTIPGWSAVETTPFPLCVSDLRWLAKRPHEVRKHGAYQDPDQLLTADEVDWMQPYGSVARGETPLREELYDDLAALRKTASFVWATSVDV